MGLGRGVAKAFVGDEFLGKVDKAKGAAGKAKRKEKTCNNCGVPGKGGSCKQIRDGQKCRGRMT